MWLLPSESGAAPRLHCALRTAGAQGIDRTRRGVTNIWVGDPESARAVPRRRPSIDRRTETVQTTAMNFASPSPIPLVAQLAQALAAAGITYCHWKSNAGIERAEQGETDLDLLVDRSQLVEFSQVLSSCGFVAAERPRAPRLPGVSDFFGYDESADRFVHVHAHFQLVVGHDRTKNYRIPIESPYLASASIQRVLPTPSPEFEYVVFVIRMILKYAILDEILWNAARGRPSGPEGSERDEFDQLRHEIDSGKVAAILDEHLPFLEPRLFAQAERVVAGGAPLRERLATARGVQAALEAHARSSPAVDATLRIWRRLAVAVRRRAGQTSKYRLASGGAIVAIMGGDGAGKSTALAEISRWLGDDFDIVRVHLGKPPWSKTTYGVRATLKGATAAMTRVRSPNESRSAVDDPDEFRRLAWLACQARDRYLAFRRARRAANRGMLILSDRYPHPELRLMDVPQIARLTEGESRGRIIEGLIRLEHRYHARVSQPDVAIVLKVDPREAARRKTDERHDYVLERSSEIWNLEWSDPRVRVIDASRAPSVVAAEIKHLIWEALA